MSASLHPASANRCAPRFGRLATNEQGDTLFQIKIKGRVAHIACSGKLMTISEDAVE